MGLASDRMWTNRMLRQHVTNYLCWARSGLLKFSETAITSDFWCEFEPSGCNTIVDKEAQ
jgi:hypothetical protein